MKEKRPKVGIAVFIFQGKQFLLWERIGKLGGKTRGLPGGKLEWGEELEACGKREVFEETGLKVEHLEFMWITNDIFDKEGEHYVTIFFTSNYSGGEVQVKEPEKCKQWKWISIDELPRNLFPPLKRFLATQKNK